MSLRIYHDGQLLEEVPYEIGNGSYGFPRVPDYPQGAILKFSEEMEPYWPGLWYDRRLRKVQPWDIPKALLALELLLGKS